MVFSSVTFLFFFLPLMLLLYLAVPLRNVVLLAGSLFFYAWGEGLYVGLLLASIAMNYAIGLRVAAARAAPHPKSRLWISLAIAANLTGLAIFKYAGLLARSANE